MYEVSCKLAGDEISIRLNIRLTCMLGLLFIALSKNGPDC